MPGEETAALPSSRRRLSPTLGRRRRPQSVVQRRLAVAERPSGTWHDEKFPANAVDDFFSGRGEWEWERKK